MNVTTKKEGKEMVQKPVIRNRQKKKNKGFIIGGSTALVLAVVGGILFTVINDDDAAREHDTNAVTASESDTAPVNTEKETPDISLSDEEAASDAPARTDEEAVAPQQEEATAAIDATTYIEGQAPATEPTYIRGILLANKQHPLPQSYNPGVDETAQKAMDEMLAAAKTAGFSLNAFSSFRSYDYQNTLYTNYVARDGQQAADRYSARPGYSEHQTGLAFDIGEVGREDIWLTDAFGETEAGKWLVANAHHHGFILRYPQGKEHLTGFMYESWHFRYVGQEVAADIQKRNVTLEEYLGVYDDVTSSTVEEEKPKVGAKTNNNGQ